MSLPPTDSDIDALHARLGDLHGVARVRDAAREERVYLVGGVVRDLLLGHERADVDLVVEGDAVALARRMAESVTVHERFGTATVRVDGSAVDLASARAESYPRPGALPDVRPGTLAEDLARRDFTINAMAMPLAGEARLIDPHDGVRDLAGGIIRVLHPASFEDDPTRALRAARYAARLELSLDPATATLLSEADLETVSSERVEAELRRIASEDDPLGGLELADAWGLLAIGAGALELVGAVSELLRVSPWRQITTLGDALIAVMRGRVERARALASQRPEGAAQAVAAARGHTGVELALARGLGAAWLDRYVSEWRAVRLEISGTDLLRAGVPEGPAVGRGLGAALRAKLDGETRGREDELEVALEAAGEGRS